MTRSHTMTLLAGLINTLIALGLVQLVKVKLLPSLREAAPWLLPVLAAAIGPMAALVQNWFVGWTGVPLALDPLIAVFTGASATAMHQVWKQAEA